MRYVKDPLTGKELSLDMSTGLVADGRTEAEVMMGVRPHRQRPSPSQPAQQEPSPQDERLAQMEAALAEKDTEISRLRKRVDDQAEKLRVPRQSGMEQQHEENTLAAVNFLARHDIRLYKGGWNPNSLEGMEKPKGRTMSIGERLKILDEKIQGWKAEARDYRTKYFEEQKEHAIDHGHMVKAEDLVEHLWRLLVDDAQHCNYKEAVTELDGYLRERRPHIFEDEEEDDGKPSV